METSVIVLIVAGVCGFLAHAIRRRPLAFALGFLLGPFGVLIACFIDKPEQDVASQSIEKPETPERSTEAEEKIVREARLRNARSAWTGRS